MTESTNHPSLHKKLKLEEGNTTTTTNTRTNANMILDNCKLSYFGLPGRGEATRLALAIANVKFTDERIAFSQWKNIKPKTPWGSIPILTLSNGTVLAQQRSILRFIGKEIGLYPMEDPFLAAKVDELMDVGEDIASKTTQVGRGLDSSAKEVERKKAVQEGGNIYDLISKIDTTIQNNNESSSGVGYAVGGDKLTVADLFLYCSISNLVSGLFDGVPPDAIDGFEHITKMRRLVRSHPSVCKFYNDSSITMPASYGAFN